MTPEFRDMLINRPRGIALLEVLELSHPSFSQTYYLLRNYVRNGLLDIKLETGQVVTAQYVPSKIQWASSKTNMDQVHNVTIQDLNDIVQAEEGRVALDDDTPISCKIRSYRSDDLTAPADGPVELEVSGIDYDKRGCTFTASPPNANETGTGERYTVERFPMLRGFTQTS
ncbi:DUF1833 family protein [Klebsiella pneumoniae]